jgi:hypothetical protein
VLTNKLSFTFIALLVLFLKSGFAGSLCVNICITPISIPPNKPFKVLYGHSPGYFGVSADYALPSPDIDDWLAHHTLVNELVRQPLLRAQRRQKDFWYRIERIFVVGGRVFLKPWSYV